MHHSGPRLGTFRFATASAWPKPGIEPSVGSKGDSYDNALAALRFSKMVLEILFLIAYHLNEFR